MAILIATLSWIDKRRSDRLSAHYGLVTVADQMIARNKELLRFRGIDHETIEDVYGVTATELGYLLQVFNSGSISHRIRFGEHWRRRAFPAGSYWYEMLRTEATQRAFPLVKQLFDAKNPFMSRCEQTINQMSRRAAVG